MKPALSLCLTIIGLVGFGLIPTHSANSSGSPTSGFGAGVILGEPTGVSLKYWIAERSAVDAVIGHSFEGRNSLYLHAGYAHHLLDLIEVGRGQFAAYFGGGVRLQLVRNRSDRFGIRGVGGVTYLFDNLPVDVFFEVNPIFDLTPNRQVRFGAGVGARYWF
jgi:hypothetical protein